MSQKNGCVQVGENCVPVHLQQLALIIFIFVTPDFGSSPNDGSEALALVRKRGANCQLLGW